LNQLHATHTGHDDVGDDEVRTLQKNRFERVLAVCRALHHELIRQGAHQMLAQGILVLDEQYARFQRIVRSVHGAFAECRSVMAICRGPILRHRLFRVMRSKQ
jgi:hypothetical protein